MTDPDDAQYFTSVDIVTTFHLAFANGERRETVNTVVVSPASLPELLETARSHVQAVGAPLPFCVISHATSPKESFSSAEHFIPEGLGYSWTRLPVDLGTCDRINERLGRAELQWLRFGPLGVFRPFYVAGGKDAPPEFHAPRKSSRRVSLLRAEDGSRHLELHTEEPLDVPDTAGPGQFVVRVRASDANSTCVSLAVHKMAYLAFWLTHANVTFDPAFVPIRDFLEAPDETSFRAVAEQMIPGAPPGVRIDFRVVLREVESESDGHRRTFGLDSLQAGLRVHHMLYFCALVGDLPDAFPGPDVTIRQWEPLDAPPRERPVEIAWGMGGLSRASR